MKHIVYNSIVRQTKIVRDSLMDTLKVKEIDKNNYWVFKQNIKPFKVKVLKRGDKYVASCKCEKFLIIGTCEHVKAVQEYLNYDFIAIKKNVQVDEYLGGDYRRYFVSFLKRISY